MIFGFFVCAAEPAGLCALAVSAAAAAAVVPNMNSRRLVGNANSLLNSTAVSHLDLSEVILQSKLQLTRIVRIVGVALIDGCSLRRGGRRHRRIGESSGVEKRDP